MISTWIAEFFSGATATIKNTFQKANRNPHPTPSNQAMYKYVSILDFFIFGIYFQRYFEKKATLRCWFLRVRKTEVIHAMEQNYSSSIRWKLREKVQIVWKVSFVILFSVVTFIFSSDPCVHKHPRHPLDFPVYTSQNIGFTTRKC